MNRLSKNAAVTILKCLVDGNSIRATSRITGRARATVTSALVSAGTHCQKYLDLKLRNLTCKRVQMDEIWAFVGCKDKSVQKGKVGLGSIWTWVAFDPDSKMVISWLTGEKNSENTFAFIKDLSSRLKYRIQLSSDGYLVYEEAVDTHFYSDLDYTMIVKEYMGNKYTGSTKKIICGNPDKEHESTSLVERQNLTMRMCMRRFTRKTNAFSKNIENHKHAIALHFMYYNFIRLHQSLKVTPAMAAGLTKRVWKLEDILFLS